MWQPISTAPYERDLELAVIDGDGGPHALVFPCRRIPGGWIHAELKKWIDVSPTHWRGRRALNPFTFFGNFRQLRLFLG
jgi:hypothetical protein